MSEYGSDQDWDLNQLPKTGRKRSTKEVRDALGRRRPVQAPRVDRSTTGISLLHRWRIRLFLTQKAVSELLGMTTSTVQKWDAHPGTEPPLLVPAMLYHEVMRKGVEDFRDRIDHLERASMKELVGKNLTTIGDVLDELRRHPSTSGALIGNIEVMWSPMEASVLYGLEHGLF